jgi:hypothetical protein
MVNRESRGRVMGSCRCFGRAGGGVEVALDADRPSRIRYAWGDKAIRVPVSGHGCSPASNWSGNRQLRRFARVGASGLPAAGARHTGDFAYLPSSLQWWDGDLRQSRRATPIAGKLSSMHRCSLMFSRCRSRLAEIRRRMGKLPARRAGVGYVSVDTGRAAVIRKVPASFAHPQRRPQP